MASENSVGIAEQIRNEFARQFGDKTDNYICGESEKFLQNDGLLLRFYNHQEEKVSEAVQMLDRFLKWRKSFGVDSICESSIATEFLERGVMYTKGLTKQGNEILWIHSRMWLSRGRDVKQGTVLLTLILERILWDRKRPNQAQVCVVMDMTSAAVSNIDMEMMKFAVNSVQNMYPLIAQCIINFQMPWVFKAAWKIVKSWLNQRSVEKVLFCGAEDIGNYIDLKYVPIHMGGTSAYVYDNKVTGIGNPDVMEEK